jgi:hypothetical protein
MQLPEGYAVSVRDVVRPALFSDGRTKSAGTAPAPTTLIEGSNQSVTKSCSDKAGNSASATVNGINIDKTAPVANATVSPAANSSGWNNSNVTVNFGWSDALSGLGTCTATQSVTEEGPDKSVSATCEDKAGNSFTATR